MAADHYSGLQLRVSNVADNVILQTLLAGTRENGKTGTREDGNTGREMDYKSDSCRNHPPRPNIGPQNDIFNLFIFSCKNFVFVITFACSRMFLCILCTLRTLI